MSIKAALDAHAKDGYLNAIRRGPLTLYDYSSKTVYDKVWNDVTIMARGLVVHDDGRVVARPFPKFFNLGERPETQPNTLPAHTPELAKKYDGSLVISFWNSDENRWQAITRGSWDNVQTRFANPWLATHATPFDKAHTYLFELVAPWNRIVVAYSEEKMILLGVIHTETGMDHPYSKVRAIGTSLGLESVHWESRPISSIDLAAKGTNEEGFVARFENGLRVKVKYDEYVLLHKTLTGLTVKQIWESLSTHTPLDLSLVPDEFMNWYRAKHKELVDHYQSCEERAKQIFAATPKMADRKGYAMHFQTQEKELVSVLFRMLDAVAYDDILWKLVRPRSNPEETFQKSEL